jgi:hypothetical protein
MDRFRVDAADALVDVGVDHGMVVLAPDIRAQPLDPSLHARLAEG